MEKKQITVLIWQGLYPPENILGSDVVIYIDPSSVSGTLGIILHTVILVEDFEKIFLDEMSQAVSNTDFDTCLELESVKEKLQQVFLVSFINSEMTPVFIGGGRLTTGEKGSLN